MQILIVKLSAFGDVVHALPVLSFIKKADASVAIDWLVEDRFADLLEGHPKLRKVYRVQIKNWRAQGILKTLRNSTQLLAALRKQHYDVVLDVQGNIKSGIFTLFSQAEKRFGFDRFSVREIPNLWSTNCKVAIKETDFHISARAIAIARKAFPAGKSTALNESPAFYPAAMQMMDAKLHKLKLNKKPLIMLHAGAAWPTKVWSLARWQQLAFKLCNQNNSVLILTWGHVTEKKQATQIAHAAGKNAYVWPRGSLAELVALVRRANLVVGGDTGPLHLAAAVGTPTVSIYRATDAHRNGPGNMSHSRLQSPFVCSPCLQKNCHQNAECAESISVSDVYYAIYKRLHPIGA